MQYITFYISKTRYGIPIYAMREIYRPGGITVVQGADEKIAGLMNLRGQIVPVLNLGICMETEPVEMKESSRLVILKSNMELPKEALELGIKTNSENVALLVDTIGEVVDWDESGVESMPPNVFNRFLVGVIKLDEEILSVISAEKLLNFHNEESDRDE